MRKRIFEVQGGTVRRPGWQPATSAGADGALATLSRRLHEARWQIPTIAELEKEAPDVPVRPLLAHLVRLGGVEQIDQVRYGSSQALTEFRETLVAALSEAGASGRATPAELRERFGLTRKYLIPLLEWADRRGITRREGDARVLVRLTRRDGDLGSSTGGT